MGFLSRLDALILTLTKRFCRWFAIRTGRNNFFLAKTAVLIHVLLTTVPDVLKAESPGWPEVLECLLALAALVILFKFCNFLDVNDSDRGLTSGKDLRTFRILRKVRVVMTVLFTTSLLVAWAARLLHLLFLPEIPFYPWFWYEELRDWSFIAAFYLVDAPSPSGIIIMAWDIPRYEGQRVTIHAAKLVNFCQTSGYAVFLFQDSTGQIGGYCSVYRFSKKQLRRLVGKSVVATGIVHQAQSPVRYGLLVDDIMPEKML